jgi:hypothetical protein
MKDTRPIFEALAPWAGLVIGIAAAAFVHQFGSDGTFDHCDKLAPVPIIVAAVVGLLATLGSGLISWRSVHSADQTRRVIAIISVGMALLFAFAILLPIIAAALIPPCFQ